MADAQPPTAKFAALSPETHAALRAAFEQHGMNYAAVARTAGVDARTAKRAWLEGWPRQGIAPLCPPIPPRFPPTRAQAKAQLREAAAEAIDQQGELVEAASVAMKAGIRQAVRDTLSEADRVKQRILDQVHGSEREIEAALQAAKDREARARAAALKAEEEEGRIVQATRNLAIVHLSQVLQISKSLPALASRLQRDMEAMANSKEPIPIERMLAALSKMGSLANSAGELARQAMDLQRLALGEPTAVIKVQAEEVPALSMADAIAEIEAAATAAQRARNKALGLEDPASEQTLEVEAETNRDGEETDAGSAAATSAA